MVYKKEMKPQANYQEMLAVAVAEAGKGLAEYIRTHPEVWNEDIGEE